jgi:hypothetical protein
VLIISADCHAGATVDGYKEYLARRWWDDFDAWKRDFVNPFADLDAIYADRNWDGQKRLRHLEEDRIPNQPGPTAGRRSSRLWPAFP